MLTSFFLLSFLIISRLHQANHDLNIIIIKFFIRFFNHINNQEVILQNIAIYLKLCIFKQNVKNDLHI